MPARELAPILLEPLLPERLLGATRARVLVNGLGSSKYEELFVLYRRSTSGSSPSGVEPVEVEVGEFVTCSTWLAAPHAVLARRRPGGVADDLGGGPWLSLGDAGRRLAGRRPLHRRPGRIPSTGRRASRRHRRLALAVRRVLHDVAAAIAAAVDEPGRLDAVAGDGDPASA
ncbi:MAG: hypothetical protein U0667_07335 [Chloroflexota bacterium]